MGREQGGRRDAGPLARARRRPANELRAGSWVWVNLAQAAGDRPRWRHVELVSVTRLDRWSVELRLTVPGRHSCDRHSRDRHSCDRVYPVLRFVVSPELAVLV